MIQSAGLSRRPLYESSESDNASDSDESDVERDSAAIRQQCLRPVELTSKNTSEDSYVPEVLDAAQQQARVLLEDCERKDWEAVKVLLESRDRNSEFIEVESKESGKTAFHYACEDAPMEIVELLLDYGADATWTNQRGSSVLNLPRVFRNEDLLRRILAEFTRKKCSVDTAESKGQTPLMLVCNEGDTLYGSAELLLESCASPDGLMQGSSCPLIIACEGGHLRLVKLLVLRGANLNSQDKRGNTALLHACKARHFSIARYLLDKEGLKVNLSDRAGTTPLFEAVSANEISAVEKLLNLGAPIDARRFISNEIMTGTVEETPLAHACARGYGDIVTLLIARGANVNYMCSQNVPPMAFAIICRQEHIIEQMMNCSELDSTIDGLSSPIIFAVKAQNYKCAKKLVDRLGGFDRTLEEASKRQLDKLIEQVKILESLDPHTISAQEMVSKQRQKVMTTSNYNGAVISNADKEATLDRFSHLCVMVIRDYEDTHNVSLEDLASLAQALYPQNPNIASFLLCVSNHMQTTSGLRKDFLFGSPSPLTFLVSQKEILTPESFCQQAVKYYGDDSVDEFYTKLVASVHTIQHGENLPVDIQGVLDHICTGRFQINLSTGYIGADSFPPDHMLPEEFRVIHQDSTSATTFVSSDGFPPESALPEEFRTKKTPKGTQSACVVKSKPTTVASPHQLYDNVDKDGFPKQDVLPSEFRTVNGATPTVEKGWTSTESHIKESKSNDYATPFSGNGYRLGSSLEMSIVSDCGLVSSETVERKAPSQAEVVSTEPPLDSSLTIREDNNVGEAVDNIIEASPVGTSQPEVASDQISCTSEEQSESKQNSNTTDEGHVSKLRSMDSSNTDVSDTDTCTSTRNRTGRLHRQAGLLNDSETPEEDRKSLGSSSQVMRRYIYRPMLSSDSSRKRLLRPGPKSHDKQRSPSISAPSSPTLSEQSSPIINSKQPLSKQLSPSISKQHSPSSLPKKHSPSIPKKHSPSHTRHPISSIKRNNGQSIRASQEGKTIQQTNSPGTSSKIPVRLNKASRIRKGCKDQGNPLIKHKADSFPRRSKRSKLARNVYSAPSGIVHQSEFIGNMFPADPVPDELLRTICALSEKQCEYYQLEISGKGKVLMRTEMYYETGKDRESIEDTIQKILTIACKDFPSVGKPVVKVEVIGVYFTS